MWYRQKQWLILMISVVECLAVFSQSIPRSRLLATVPFRLAPGGVIILKAAVKPFTDSLNFILDTGCGGISLDSATAEALQIPFLVTDYTIRTISGVHPDNLPRRQTYQDGHQSEKISTLII